MTCPGHARPARSAFAEPGAASLSRHRPEDHRWWQCRPTFGAGTQRRQVRSGKQRASTTAFWWNAARPDLGPRRMPVYSSIPGARWTKVALCSRRSPRVSSPLHSDSLDLEALAPAEQPIFPHRGAAPAARAPPPSIDGIQIGAPSRSAMADYPTNDAHKKSTHEPSTRERA